MRGLFFKVFIILWIAQSLIFVISTALILRRHFDRPDVFFDAIRSSMQAEAKDAVAAFESGGCAGPRETSLSASQPAKELTCVPPLQTRFGPAIFPFTRRPGNKWGNSIFGAFR